MQVVSLAPIPVATLPWRMGEGPWVLSLICKLTLRLEPGVSPMHKLHEAIYDRDKFVNNGQIKSLYAPNDLVPTRPLVDVLLVGNAFSPHRAPVTTLMAGMSLMTLKKQVCIEANARGDTFRVASLAYEHAHPTMAMDTGLPIGTGQSVDLSKHDTASAPPPFSASDPRVRVLGDAATAGFGPIAPEWSERRALLGSADIPTPLKPGEKRVLPKDFNMKFFNTAPRDQQLPELAPNAELLLENLSVDHPRLTTRLPNVAPQVFVERQGAQRDEHGTDISALWIDTCRAIATITWHCHVPLKSLDEPGKIFVAVAGPGRRLNTTGLERLIGSLGGSRAAPAPRRKLDSLETTIEDTKPKAAHSVPSPGSGSLPPPLPVAALPVVALPVVALPVLDEQGGAHTSPPPADIAAKTGATHAVDPHLSLGEQGPDWVKQRTAPQPAPEAPPFATKGPDLHLPPPVVAPGAHSIAGTWLPRPPTPKLNEPIEDTGGLPNEPLAKRETIQVPDPSDVVELLWFESTATMGLRRVWPVLCDDLAFAPRDNVHDLITDDPKKAREHHTHFGVITEAKMTSAGELAMELRNAISETGRFSPPLVVLRGQLQFPFDEVEALRATAAAVTPVAGDDKKIRVAIDQVQELLQTPLFGGSAQTVRNFMNHLRRLYRDSDRSPSLDKIDKAVERMLLEKRCYQKRAIFGEEMIRALFEIPGTRQPLPTYLPQTLEEKLPMMVMFTARIIAEANVRQDQYEDHDHALRVVSLGRVITLSR